MPGGGLPHGTPRLLATCPLLTSRCSPVTAHESRALLTYCILTAHHFLPQAYTSSVGLYQHKRSKHPWLIKQRPRRETTDGADEEYRFTCPSPGCTKAYRTSMGLYQHKRTKHPWLIKQRERGYQRPAYRAGV